MATWMWDVSEYRQVSSILVDVMLAFTVGVDGGRCQKGGEEKITRREMSLCINKWQGGKKKVRRQDEKVS